MIHRSIRYFYYQTAQSLLIRCGLMISLVILIVPLVWATPIPVNTVIDEQPLTDDVSTEIVAVTDNVTENLAEKVTENSTEHSTKNIAEDLAADKIPDNQVNHVDEQTISADENISDSLIPGDIIPSNIIPSNIIPSNISPNNISPNNIDETITNNPALIIEQKMSAELDAGNVPESSAEITPTLDNSQAAEQIIVQTAFSIIGEPKYKVGFSHFDYADPAAPKGGSMQLAAIGFYDNFNRYASRGSPEHYSGEIYEKLFAPSEDELDSFYPLIATSITYSDTYQWAEVTLNPNAYFHDGVPITASDVEFSFHKFMTEGVSQYRVYNQGITVTALEPYRVRIEIPTPSREQLLSFVGSLTVIPQHCWQDKNFSEPLTTPPIGSAPYYISDYRIGQYVVYHLDENYWGKDLPVNQGLNNFERKRIEYYLDDSIALEAFKAGEYDLRGEAQPKNWFTQYSGDYFDQQLIIKKEDDVVQAVETRWLAFNLANPLFQDRNVRHALTLAFDFSWLNHAYYYDSYLQPMSFFTNTPYAAQGLPSEQEYVWLNQYRDVIPPAAFGEVYSIPASNGDGFNRQNLLQATQLLAQAGWVVENNRLVHQQTKQPFEFELLTYMGSDNKYLIPFQKQLAQLGIVMTISEVDYTQINRRLRNRDYDMMPTRYLAHDYPSSTLMIVWGSQYLNSSWNASGLHNVAIDGLIEQIIHSIDDEDKLLNLGRALDRILTHEYPMIPMWYPRSTYYAYWNKFSQPSIKPLYSIGINTWWYDSDKAQQLPKNHE